MALGSKVGYLARIDSAKENAAVLTAVTQHLTDEQLGETMAEDGRMSRLCGWGALISPWKEFGLE